MAIVDDPEGHEAAALARLVPDFSGLRVLEVGCGHGRLTRKYWRQAASVIAIDPDEDAVNELGAEAPGIDARAVGIHDLVLPRGSLDLAIFAWSL